MQVSEDMLFQTANYMFPEGQGAPRPMPKDGAAAPLIHALLFNTKMRESVCSCMRAATVCGPLERFDATAAAAMLPVPRARVAHDLPASFAAPSQASALSQRRRRAPIRPAVEG